MFHFYTYFHRFLNIFLLDLLVYKFALVSFYTYFPGILTILQISFIFQTPPRPPRGPPQDPLGPLWDPPRTPRKQKRVAHQAGTEPEFVNDVDGMRVAH